MEARSGKLAWTLLCAALEGGVGLCFSHALFEGGRGPAGAAVTLADNKAPDYTVSAAIVKVVSPLEVAMGAGS
jgi:hypothetical protein